MLDKQFFQDEQFHPYLTQNFFLFRAQRGKQDGEEVYKKFSVRVTPTVLIAMADGAEIDRLIGFGGNAEEFKNRVENAYKGEYTYLNLTQAYQKDSTDLTVIARLANKYLSRYDFDAMKPFAEKITQQPEKSKQLMLPFGEDDAEVSAYEFAKYAATYSGPEQVLEFTNEFPTSSFLKNAFRNFGRSLSRRGSQEKALKVFDQLIKKYPENPQLVGAYLDYCARSDTNIDRGIELAERVYAAKEGKVDFGFATSYAELLIETGDTKTVQKITDQLVKDNPDDEIDILFRLGYLYMKNQKYQMAFETFESLLKNHPDYKPALYWIGQVAANSGTNLDRGIECLKKYMQQEPEEGQPQLTMAHLRLGAIYEHKGDTKSAKKEYEAALKLNPRYSAAKKAIEKLDKK